ncbi:hypothetical protein [uncultured Fibrobacter sp.]|uniref:hypothetical protein n=1 Tax=uncultured Fibrobacter sp. TaxID=261512 RepID=UPI0025FB29AF|nr:hypothetical protein [uncultured Fibrobacter sp.]
MKKKNLVVAILSLVAFSFAAKVQVLPPSGAEFATDAPNMVQSIVRAAVGQTGNTLVESGADVQLRTTLMTMGSSIIVVCEQVKDGAVVGTGKEKASSIENLDVAIEIATKQALANLAANESAEPQVVYVDSPERSRDSGEDPNDKFAHKRPTRNYASYGLGMAMWHNYNYTDASCKNDAKCHKVNDVDRSWEKAFVFHYARIFETAPQGAITIVNNMDITFGDGWEWHEAFLIGGRFFFSTGMLTPYLGAGLGLGVQVDDHYNDRDEYFAVGLACGTEAGIIFFRNSSVQLELGFAWDALWDGFDSIKRRFGAGSVYIAINY